jgi:hypothetical protein
VNSNTSASCGCIALMSTVKQFSTSCGFKKGSPKKSFKKLLISVFFFFLIGTKPQLLNLSVPTLS